jgi:ABC-type bacteriocin/lantibiotic exporter with double-glycine peptidase domain
MLWVLWTKINHKFKKSLVLTVSLMFFSSFVEILSLGSMVPFLGIISAPDRIFDNTLIKNFFNAFGYNTASEILLPVTVIFCLFALLAGLMRIVVLRLCAKVSYAIGSDLSLSIYRRILYQPYSSHLSRKSSEVINGVSGKINTVTFIINSILTLLISIFLMIAIVGVLVAVNPMVTIITLIGFGSIYIFIILLMRKKLSANSKEISLDTTRVISSIQEGLGGIRDILLDGTQEVFCRMYSEADSRLRKNQEINFFISSSPRFIIEALALFIMAALAYFLTKQDDTAFGSAIPILGILALGAQRLLPLLQAIYSSIIGIIGNRTVLKDTLELLDLPLPKTEELSVENLISFSKNITLSNIWFQYNKAAPWVINGANLTISKGSTTGFLGVTGSGKSTLIDIIMGLLSPSQGFIEIDGKKIGAHNQKSWQNKIAHVPQTIYLSDNTVEENIAFGIPKSEIDKNRVREVASLAQISKDIESWPCQYQTLVGERGSLLSGGQRQRIGIARALYKKADVIIFDEATSALDGVTEKAIMETILGLSGKITLLIIAHRLTTLEGCTQIVEIKDGISCVIKKIPLS